MENIFMYVRKIVVPLEADVLTAKARDFSDRRWHSHDTGWLKYICLLALEVR